MIELDRTQHEALTCEAPKVLLAGPRGTGKSSVVAERAIWLILECDVAPERIVVAVASPDEERAMREICEKPLRKMQYKTVPDIVTHNALKNAAPKDCAHLLVDDAQDADDAARKVIAAYAGRGAILFVAVRTPGETDVPEQERSAGEKALAAFSDAARFDLVWIYRKPDAKKKRGPSAGEEQMSLF